LMIQHFFITYVEQEKRKLVHDFSQYGSNITFFIYT
jgi:hypothetical protein